MKILLKLFLHVLVVPVVLVVRLIRPWLMVRWRGLITSRIGHFAANTEMYLCEQNAGINIPKQRYLDIFYMASRPICNEQLAVMWKRVLHIWPTWIMAPIIRVNRMIPGGGDCEIGNNTQGDLDVYNLLDRFPPHLKFTPGEEARGEACLRVLGVSHGARFVCLMVRDSAYMDVHKPGVDWGYHSYRDSNIRNFISAAEALAVRGYFVLRMGAKVRETMKISHPRIIDYATNGMRSDFMDIYLGAKCEFCITTGMGLDAIPYIFRRPMVYVNMVPFGLLCTYRKEFISLTKMHVSKEEGRRLTISEIFNRGVGFCLNTSGYESEGIRLIENAPEEIRDVVIEMIERLNDTWEAHADDEALQRRFRKLFPKDAVDTRNGRPLHGEIRSRFGASFLRNNREWLE